MESDILILGDGYIGNKLRDGLGAQLSGMRISSVQDAACVIEKHRPKILVNCIGHFGGNTSDACEMDPDRTLFSNSYVPILLAEVCRSHKVKLVHMSTGCIYDPDPRCDEPISEERIPDFFGLFYSRSKISSEAALHALSHGANILIIRLRIPLDDRPHPRNLLTKLIGYRKAIDVPNSVTYIPDFLKAVRHLIDIDAHGLYNVVNKGGLRYPALLDVYMRHVPSFQYEITEPSRLGLVRTNLVLSTKKLESTGYRVRAIEEVLEECVTAYVRCSSQAAQASSEAN